MGFLTVEGVSHRFPGVHGGLQWFPLTLRDTYVLRQNLPAVVALATVGVGLTTLVVGALGHWALGLAVPFAILFGVLTIILGFRLKGVNDRLVHRPA